LVKLADVPPLAGGLHENWALVPATLTERFVGAPGGATG